MNNNVQSREQEVAEIGMEVLAEMLLSVSPSIANIAERQQRTESMLLIAEKIGVLPKGINTLGDLILERIRKDEQVVALREVAQRSSILPFEYAEKLKEARERVEENDVQIGKLIKELTANG